MANLDITELLDDPDFADVISVIRRTQVINAYGEATETVTQFNNIDAIVQPATGSVLQTLPEYIRAAQNIQVFTKFILQLATDTKFSDVVVWKNRNWTVSRILDYSNYGFSQVVCTIRSPTGKE